MNCRQCAYFWQDYVSADGLQWEAWPCSKGVASLPTPTPDYLKAEADGPLMFLGQTHYQKLPWMIENHECPEFDENS